MPDVAHQLNQDGITTKRGNEWSRWAVKQVLSNEVYRGQYQLAHYEDHVEEYRIITDELFEAVTEIRHRFQHEKGEMDKDRKEAKVEKIYSEYKSDRGGD